MCTSKVRQTVLYTVLSFPGEGCMIYFYSRNSLDSATFRSKQLHLPHGLCSSKFFANLLWAILIKFRKSLLQFSFGLFVGTKLGPNAAKRRANNVNEKKLKGKKSTRTAKAKKNKKAMKALRRSNLNPFTWEKLNASQKENQI